MSTRFLSALLTVLLVTACTTGRSTPTYSPSPSPSTSSGRPVFPSDALSWPVPNDRLTPGLVVKGCTYPRPKSQRDVPTSEKTVVAGMYHYTGPRALVEFDHRVPFSLCGDNGVTNIWPEPYDGVTTSTYIHNRKDELELAIASKVRHHTMTLPQAQAIFLGDWRVGWCTYVHTPGVTC